MQLSHQTKLHLQDSEIQQDMSNRLLEVFNLDSFLSKLEEQNFEKGIIILSNMFKSKVFTLYHLLGNNIHLHKTQLERLVQDSHNINQQDN